MDLARGIALARRSAGSALAAGLIGITWLALAGCHATGAASRATAGAGSVRLTGLAGSVTAKADVGLINATGLTSASVSLTTRVGGISASFTAAPTAVRASANVGAITVHVPGTTSYKVAADAR